MELLLLDQKHQVRSSVAPSEAQERGKTRSQKPLEGTQWVNNPTW